MRRVPVGEKLYSTLIGLADPLWEENPAKDRTAAIMGATFLEHALRQSISRCFAADEYDPDYNYLFELEDAPYREFAGRVRLARALGIVDKSEYDQIEAIRHIRNAFAHTMEDVSFSAPEIAAYFGDLTVLHGDGSITQWLDVMAPKHTILGSMPSVRASRAAFVYAIFHFFWKLTNWFPEKCDGSSAVL